MNNWESNDQWKSRQTIELEEKAEWASRRQLAGKAIRVGIGDAAVTSGSTDLRATLGSCVGVCIAHPKTGRIAMAHVLLPTASARDKPGIAASRCADTVIPFLLEELDVSLAKYGDLVAFVAGGAAIYKDANQRSTVGEDNGRTIVKELKAHGIQIGGRDLGGNASRQIVADGATGHVFTLNLGEGEDGVAWPHPSTFTALWSKTRNILAS